MGITQKERGDEWPNMCLTAAAVTICHCACLTSNFSEAPTSEILKTVMGSVLSSNGLLFVDTLDSTETTNRLHAFDALTGTLLASSVCAGIFNIDDFVAFSRD
jgi:hypothetical protein